MERRERGGEGEGERVSREREGALGAANQAQPPGALPTAFPLRVTLPRGPGAAGMHVGACGVETSEDARAHRRRAGGPERRARRRRAGRRRLASLAAQHTAAPSQGRPPGHAHKESEMPRTCQEAKFLRRTISAPASSSASLSSGSLTDVIVRLLKL